MNSLMPKASAYDTAIRLLARREHAARELKDKLLAKGYGFSEVEQALSACQQAGFQSDARFAESFLRARAAQGYGPQRIRQELNLKGVDEAEVEAAFAEAEIDWLASATAVWQKKAAMVEADERRHRQKVKQYMFYRGFGSSLIQAVEQALS